MHELSIALALVRQLEELAQRQGAVRVESARVQVGPLAGVEAHLLARAFPLATAGSVAEGCRLVLESCPVRVRCSQCQQEGEVVASRLVCPFCGEWRTTLTSGDQLILASVSLHLADDLAWRLTLGGLVQGVGFRPFVHQVARDLGLTGWVRNLSGLVEIHLQGPPPQLDKALSRLLTDPPPGATPRVLSQAILPLETCPGFAIREGGSSDSACIVIPPDASLCPDCRTEVDDAANRRHDWPFTACTRCGPRYTIIHHFPYERNHTSLAGFPLCPACTAEYRNPADRRFHAQATGCPTCGPQLSWETTPKPLRGFGGDYPPRLFTAPPSPNPCQGPDEQTIPPLLHCLTALRAGLVVAVQGIGGYHLLCDATNPRAITHLRACKPRPHKPLAVLLPWRGADGLAVAETLFHLSPAHRQALCHPSRPIVLCPARESPGSLAPGLGEVGAMLPYSPLHHLLTREMGVPLVATSANPSGEPVLWSRQEACDRLQSVADGFLHHNRPILRPADDPVVRVIAGEARPLRLGRGTAPLEMPLPRPLDHPTLAVGGEQKITLALGWGDRAVISPHIGEIHSPRGMALFQQVVEELQSLLGVRATRLVRDGHPGYATSRWAMAQNLDSVAVRHHHAHAHALAAEAGDDQPWIVFTWDGVGLGDDGTLWGGEALAGQPGHWRHAATWRPFALPGGDQAARQPWRLAAALCWEANRAPPPLPDGGELLHHAWKSGLNCPRTSAVGRLFDGAAALLGLLTHATYEGQGPMLLEALAAAHHAPLPPFSPLPLHDGEILTTDWQPLLPMLTHPGLAIGEKAALFHHALARALLDQAVAIRRQSAIHRVGLCGGVFQNALLCHLALALLAEHGFQTFLPARVPVNDAGLSFGQLAALPYIC